MPLVAAVVCVPYLVQGLGITRFGFLTIAWVIVGYFGLFDFGIGRALTRSVASSRAENGGALGRPIVWTGLLLLAGIGLVGVGAIFAVGGLALKLIGGIDLSSSVEYKASTDILAVSVFFVVVTAGVRGVLDAYGQFAVSSAIRAGIGLAQFGGPLVVLMYSDSLTDVVLLLATVRAIGMVLHFAWMVRVIDASDRTLGFDVGIARNMIGFGGWLTVSGIVSPMMTYLDRVLIGGIVGLATVAYYTTPYEIVSRLSVVPESMTAILFPLFASRFSTGKAPDPNALALAMKGVLIVVAPIAIVLCVFHRPLLELWLGAEFAERSGVVLLILGVGYLWNSLARVPLALVQAAGHARYSAMVHLSELPLFVLALYIVTPRWGIEGAAAVSAGRMAVDYVLMHARAMRVAPGSRTVVLVTCPALVLTGALVLSLAVHSNSGRAALATSMYAALVLFTLTVSLSAKDIYALKQALTFRWNGGK